VHSKENKSFWGNEYILSLAEREKKLSSSAPMEDTVANPTFHIPLKSKVFLRKQAELMGAKVVKSILRVKRVRREGHEGEPSRDAHFFIHETPK
jgi:hypothetical protein